MERKKIYLIRSIEQVFYDEYFSVVIVAHNKNEAVNIALNHCFNFKKDRLNVKKIGLADNNTLIGVILDSFNNG